MNQVLRTGERVLIPLLLVLAVWWFLRGHHLPGGGFIAGLVAVSALAFRAVARGATAPRRRDALSGGGTSPPGSSELWGLRSVAVGLGLALVSGVFALVVGQAPMTGLWTSVLGVKVGTVLLFDLGVFFVVLGFGSEVLRRIAAAPRRS